MRSYSTAQSALNLEITKLAIAECVVSVGLYIGIGMVSGTFRYLSIAVILAPLTLFRTDRSVAWGLQTYQDKVRILSSDPGPIGVLAPFFIAPFIGAAVRVASTVYWTIRAPIQTLRETPQNWLRQSFCTDFAYPPEIVPQEALTDDPNLFKFTDLIQVLREDEGPKIDFIFLVYALAPIIVIGWLPSLIYRVSFKATTLVYLPFIWVAHATLQERFSIKSRLERVTKGEIEKLRRAISWIILATLVAKLAFVLGWMDKSYLVSKFPSQDFITDIVRLDSIPWWQITLGFDACATFLLLFFADAALARLEDDRPWRESVVLNTVAIISFLRAAISVVTIAGLFYLTLGSVAPSFVRHFTD